jgi:hypothetical protein
MVGLGRMHTDMLEIEGLLDYVNGGGIESERDVSGRKVSLVMEYLERWCGRVCGGFFPLLQVLFLRAICIYC